MGGYPEIKDVSGRINPFVRAPEMNSGCHNTLRGIHTAENHRWLQMAGIPSGLRNRAAGLHG